MQAIKAGNEEFVALKIEGFILLASRNENPGASYAMLNTGILETV